MNEQDKEWKKLVDEGWVLSDEEEAALREAVKTGDAKGIGRKTLTRKEEEVVDSIRALDGGGPAVVRREKTVSVLVNLTPSAREGLRRIAEAYDYWHGGHGNLSVLLEAIGQGKLSVVDGPQTPRK